MNILESNICKITGMISTTYLKKFIFQQKCVPWFILKRWCTRIDLEKVIVVVPCDQNGEKGGVEYTTIYRGHRYTNMFLKDSPFVKFLQEFGNVERIDEPSFKKSDYFKMAANEIKIYGHYFGIRDKNRLISQAYYFLNLFHAVKNKTFYRDFDKFNTIGLRHSKEKHSEVIRIASFSYYLINDGNHRLAAFYVLGQRFAKARIVDKKEMTLKDLAHKDKELKSSSPLIPFLQTITSAVLINTF